MTIEPIYSERDYLAPTVYKRSGVLLTSSWNYYNSLADAVNKYWFLNQRGSTNPAPVGYVTFTPDTSAQTFGINCDFYIFLDNKWQLTTYKYLRGLSTYPPMVFRFTTREGNGPYYAIFDPKTFALSATAVDSVSSEKLAALDGFYREVQLMKYRYNSLAGFLNTLAQKPLTPTEQTIFNQGVLKLQNMGSQMQTLKGIEISFTTSGAVLNGFGGRVGIIPFLIIAIVAILAAATAWTITSIIDMQQRTKQINDTYELNKWVATKKAEIAAQVNSGALTQPQAQEIYSTLDGATASANKIAANASSSTGIFGEVTGLVKWGLLGYVVIMGMGLLKHNKTVPA